MTRQQVLELIDQQGTLLELEYASVRYTIDFNCTPKKFDNRLVFELGRNEIDIAIVVDPQDGHVHFYSQKMSVLNKLLVFTNAPRVCPRRRMIYTRRSPQH